jgi:hypothetical protein
MTLLQDAINMVAVSCEHDDPFDMINKLIKRIHALEAAVEEAAEFIDSFTDVEDDVDGPYPNKAMHLYCYLNETLEG